MNNRFFEITKLGLRKSDLIEADPNIDLSNIDDDFCVHSLSNLENATEGDLSFFTITMVSGDKYRHLLENTKASYCLLKSQYASVNSNVKPIITDEPYITFVRLCNKVFLKKKNNNNKSMFSESAVISEYSSIGNGVKIGDNVVIEDFVTIDDGVEIGNGCVIKSGVKIGYNCVIGDNCELLENCVIKYTELGNNCCIHSNTTIGQDGFGYVFDRRSNKNEKIYHFGTVKIGNDVEIGSNTCVDRSVFDSTIIEDGVKIDNLVQIAHNVKIGSDTVIAGQAGIAGSTTIGKNCMIGGKSGINGHITINDQCIIYGATNVAKDFPKHSKIIGSPGELYHIWVKNYAIMQNFLKRKRHKVSSQGNSGFISYINNLIKPRRK